MGNALSQSYFIPKPTLTEKNLPSQAGKVFIVTGGYAGCGLELCRILYGANGSVYIAGRSQSKADAAIASIQKSHPSSTGKLSFLSLDLSDLSTIKPAAEAFMAKESRLDVLTNNAGVMVPPAGSKDAHGHDLQLGTNCLGPFLLTKLLQPAMKTTAASSPAAAVRVTWAGSLAIDMGSPSGGVTLQADGTPNQSGPTSRLYGQSKAGNLLLAAEAARRFPDSGIMHLCWNPGNLQTELQRHLPGFIATVLNVLMLYPAVYGAYTELWAGWAQEVGMEANGKYVAPWGRIGTNRADVVASTKTKDQGGTGVGEAFWEWCDEQTKAFA